jgi:Zn-dependent M16 (insulinase) family peptidase
MDNLVSHIVNNNSGVDVNENNMEDFTKKLENTIRKKIEEKKLDLNEKNIKTLVKEVLALKMSKVDVE